MRRPYWPKVAWVGLALCGFGVLVLRVNCYCPGYYLFWAAICCGVIFVGRRWCSGLALVVLVFALAYTVRDYRGLQKEQAISEKSIAVLPLKNLSEAKADADFAEEVQGEILTRLASVVASPQRWDIIVFHPPAAATREATVWPLRVVGLPGERISIESDGIHIDGKLVRQPDSIRDIRYIAIDPRVQSAITFPFTIPSDSYFVLGDNTTDSFDSRFWGAIPKQSILGRVRHK